MIGLLGGGMATLAGCFGGSQPDDSDSTDDESDEESENSTETPIAPEERSQYIESTEIVVTNEGTVTSELELEVTVVDSYDWIDIELLTESRVNYSRGGFGTGEIQTSVPLTDSVDHTEPVPPGEHTLLLDAMDLEAEVPFTLSAEMELVEAVAGTNREDLSEGSLGLVFRNTGPSTNAAARVIDDGYDDELAYNPIQPGETGLVEIDGVLDDDTIQCDDDQGVHDEEYSIEFLWSDTLTVNVPIEYTDGTTSPCERSLAGTATVVSREEGTES
jgi:hypothetical protein